MKSPLSSANKSFLYALRLKTSLQNAELLENFLEEKGIQLVVMHDLIKKTAIFEKYFDSFSEAHLCKKELLVLLKNAPLQYSEDKTNCSVKKIKKEDWSESWKKNFNTIKISKRIIIKPSWETFAPKKEQIVIEIDPGMSFGTGKHATTAACLKLIDMILPKSEKKSFLDIGCGSGILSIAAAKLGFYPCVAFDNDPLAVSVARKNFRINKVANKIKLFKADIASFRDKRKFNVVAANLLSSILNENAQKIAKTVAKNGILILSGILKSEYNEIANLYARLGFHEEKKILAREWATGLFIRNT